MTENGPHHSSLGPVAGAGPAERKIKDSDYSRFLLKPFNSKIVNTPNEVKSIGVSMGGLQLFCN